MGCDVELVPVGADGQIRIPERFRHNGAPLRGAYVIPRLARNSVVMVPATDWADIHKDTMSYARSSVEARRLKRASSPWAQLNIDRQGCFELPLRVRRRASLGRNVVLELVVDSITIRAEAEFESALDSTRRINSDMEAHFKGAIDQPSVTHSGTVEKQRPPVHPIMKTSVERIPLLTATQLQTFVRECFWNMGFRCAEVGSTFARDGGVDHIAISPPSDPFPSVLAVQVTRRKSKVGPAKIREFAGAIQSQQVSAGIVITNSSFTEEARRWTEKHNETHSQRIFLKDIDTLIEWSRGNFSTLQYENEIKSTLHLCKGVTLSIEEGWIGRRW